jgi:hypothetical protein
MSERFGDLEDSRHAVVGDALMSHGDGQGTFVFARIAGLVQNLVHGIGHRNLLGTDYMAPAVPHQIVRESLYACAA